MTRGTPFVGILLLVSSISASSYPWYENDLPPRSVEEENRPLNEWFDVEQEYVSEVLAKQKAYEKAYENFVIFQNILANTDSYFTEEKNEEDLEKNTIERAAPYYGRAFSDRETCVNVVREAPVLQASPGFHDVSPHQLHEVVCQAASLSQKSIGHKSPKLVHMCKPNENGTCITGYKEIQLFEKKTNDNCWRATRTINVPAGCKCH